MYETHQEKTPVLWPSLAQTKILKVQNESSFSNSLHQETLDPIFPPLGHCIHCVWTNCETEGKPSQGIDLAEKQP